MRSDALRSNATVHGSFVWFAGLRRRRAAGSLVRIQFLRDRPLGAQQTMPIGRFRFLDARGLAIALGLLDVTLTLLG